jgi:hypothetical protein
MGHIYIHCNRSKFLGLRWAKAQKIWKISLPVLPVRTALPDWKLGAIENN